MKRHFTILVLAIAISLSGYADAKLKIYKSNSNLPFIEMMLNMMVVMGILDKIPPEMLSYGGYPASSLGHQGLAYSNLGKQDLMKRYLASRYPGAAYPGSYGNGLHQNPLSGFPGASPYRNRFYNNHHPAGAWLPMRSSSCVGGSCLSQRGNSLNGLWVNQEGEMLGIKNDQFLWSDGRDSYMSGLMNISDDRVVANVDGSNRQISYQYKVQGNELLTKDSNGTVRRFRRVAATY